MKLKDKGATCRYLRTAMTPIAALSIFALLALPDLTYANNTAINDCDVVVSDGWSASAYMGSARLLRTKFGVDVPLYAQDSENSLWDRPTAIDPKTETEYTKFPRVQCQCPAGDTGKNHGDCELYYDGL